MKSSNLSLKLIHEPGIKSEVFGYSPLCVDNKIHIRFRDYTKQEIISGLEAKLTYLLTYLFTKEFVYKEVTREDDKINLYNFHYIWDKYMPKFLSSDSVVKVRGTLFDAFNADNILLMPKYVKKEYLNPWEQFGYVSDGTYIAVDSNDRLNGSGSLNKFLETFHLTLEEFLLDDSYYLVIGLPADPQNMNEKFINKTMGREKKQTKVILPVNLW